MSNSKLIELSYELLFSFDAKTAKKNIREEID